MTCGAALEHPQLSASLEITMTKNVGGIDRILRIVVGIALIALAVTGTVGLWGYIGVVPLLTGLIGWCPVYLPLGLKTCGCSK
jgi:hypothetical protein